MEILLTSIIAFVSTNLDDIFLLTLFFGDKSYKPTDIYIGQYLGITFLIVVSVIGSFVGNFIDGRYVGLLGLFPIYLGLRQAIRLIKGKDETTELEQKEISGSTGGILSVSTVTIANGGDNIGTYIPLFATLKMTDKSIMIAIFLAMTFVWVAAANFLTTRPVLKKAISSYGHIITPVVLCLLGLFILKENGSFSLLK